MNCMSQTQNSGVGTVGAEGTAALPGPRRAMGSVPVGPDPVSIQYKRRPSMSTEGLNQIKSSKVKHVDMLFVYFPFKSKCYKLCKTHFYSKNLYK